MEDTVIYALKTLGRRMMCNPLFMPLPTHLMYLIQGSFISNHNLRLTFTLIRILVIYVVAYNTYKSTLRIVSASIISVYAIGEAYNMKSYDVISLLLTILFINSKNSIYLPLVFGLMVCTNLKLLSFAVLMIFIRSVAIHNYCINKDNKIGVYLFKNFIIMFILPVLMFLVPILIDIKIRSNYGPNDLSFEYNNSLIMEKIPFYYENEVKNYELLVDKDYQHDYTINPMQYNSSTYKNVIDRNLVSIFNIHQQVFFPEGDNKKKLVTIVKIHEDEFEDEKNRYISNGDRVKIIVDGKYLYIKEFNAQQKFHEVEFKLPEEAEKEFDNFIVICDDKLTARSTFKLQHLKSNLQLCCKDDGFYFSIEALNKSREFAINDNIMHNYYLQRFNSEDIHEKVGDIYSYLSFKEKVIEYINNINSESKEELNMELVACFSIFSLVLLLYNLFKRRYAKHYTICPRVLLCGFCTFLSLKISNFLFKSLFLYMIHCWIDSFHKILIGNNKYK